MNTTQNDFISQFVSQFIDTAPSGLLGAKEELTQWAHTFVCDWFAQHELITQQEFMVQQKILQRLQTQVEKLECQLSESKQTKKEKDFTHQFS